MYTPGPWTTETAMELTSSGERRPATYISATKGWANSGMAKQRTVAIVGHWRDRPNPESDARLIAAAPDLLDALEVFLHYMERDFDMSGDDDHLSGAIMLAYNKALEAIEKARC